MNNDADRMMDVQSFQGISVVDGRITTPSTLVVTEMAERGGGWW